MTRRQLEHIIRAAAGTVDARDMAFVEAMVRRDLASPQIIRERLARVSLLSAERQQLVKARLDEWSLRRDRQN